MDVVIEFVVEDIFKSSEFYTKYLGFEIQPYIIYEEKYIKRPIIQPIIECKTVSTMQAVFQPYI